MSAVFARAGDHVLHVPSGETWVVAYVDGDDLAWCGWPDGLGRTSDCTVTRRCTDAEHVAMLHEIAASGGRRALRARIALAAMGVEV